MNKKKFIILTITVTAIILFIILIFVLITKTSNIKVGFVENNYNNVLNASFKYFDGAKEKNIEFNKKKTVTIEYSLNEKKGSLELQVKDSDGNLVKSQKGTGEGNFEFKIEKTQKYTICILATKAEGNYNIKWFEE